MMQTRTLAEADLNGLVELYHRFNPDDAPLAHERAAEIYRAILGHPGCTLFGAFHGGTLASTCTLIVVPNLTRGGASYAFIENVVTHPDHRGLGHGRAVLDAAVARASALGCYKIMLLTAPDNPGVHRFYERCGFSRAKAGFEIRPTPSDVHGNTMSEQVQIADTE